MSKLSDLQSRLRSLQDIGAILNAMKNLALVEMTKISRFYATQQELFRSVQRALADFQHFYGRTTGPETRTEAPLYILIGSERGFCGGFNDAVCNQLKSERDVASSARLLLVGRKLALKLPDDKRVVRVLDGPSAAEEIPLVISSLARELARFPGGKWRIIYNSYSTPGTEVKVAYPFEFPADESSPRFQFAPLINLPAVELRPQLFEQYLFALFYGIFYLSFMSENHARLRHMDGALNKLQEEHQHLRQVSNSLRQEGITEELELIMLSIDDSQVRRAPLDGAGDKSTNR